MISSLRVAIIVIVAAALLGFLVWRVWNRPVPPDVELRQAPEVFLRDYDGREVKISDFNGKATIINSWASWCPFCREELVNLAAARKEFAGSFTVLGINRAESLEEAKRYSDSLGVNGEILFLLDPEDSFYKSIDGFSMPETIFVDKDGAIKYHKRGPVNLEEMRRRVQDYFEL